MKIDTYFIKKSIINWYDSNKRDLPWRIRSSKKSDISYYVLVSEIMLQQTTVATVKGKYEKFIKLWPNINALSKAKKSEILTFWSGLGYYKRAINLLETAKIIKKKYNSKIPNNEKKLMILPGIGKYTSAAILSIAFNKPVMAVDANVQRIITRIYGLTSPISKISKKIDNCAKNFILPSRPGDMVQALMDYGSEICKPRNPLCNKCVFKKYCNAFNKKITNEIPFRNKINISNKPVRYACAYILVNEDKKILLRKRSSEGMLASMMEVPTSNWLKKRINYIEMTKSSPIRLNYKIINKAIKYSFSHFNLNVKILVGHTNIKKIKGYTWHSLEKLDSIELPTIMKKIIMVFVKQNSLN